ncbi:MAG: hypothetical protein NW241_22860 [Bacteroidia bacterium]|nr:hypothetical protein [Bacteroidia bacterium]
MRIRFLPFLPVLLVLGACKPDAPAPSLVSTEPNPARSLFWVRPSGVMPALPEGTVYRHGFCLSLSPDPDAPCELIVGQAGAPEPGKAFSQLLAPVEPGKTYYVRAYVNFNDGNVYGEPVAVTTAPMQPSILEQFDFQANGLENGYGGFVADFSVDREAPREYTAVCWSETDSLPDVDGPSYKGDGVFAMAVVIPSFTPGQRYYARAAAKIAGQIYYSRPLTFTPLP